MSMTSSSGILRPGSIGNLTVTHIQDESTSSVSRVEGDEEEEEEG